jgi:hypothetical protein
MRLSTRPIHTPVKILLGGSGDIAYTNGERDYDQISALGIPIILLSKAGAGHGGDLTQWQGGLQLGQSGLAELAAEG